MVVAVWYDAEFTIQFSFYINLTRSKTKIQLILKLLKIRVLTRQVNKIENVECEINKIINNTKHQRCLCFAMRFMKSYGISM